MLRVSSVLIAFALIFQPHLMGEEKVIIAVASDGETLKATVSHTAARCPYFLIVDSKGKLLEAVENPTRIPKVVLEYRRQIFLPKKM